MVAQSLRRDWLALCRQVREWGDWQSFGADHWYRAGSGAIGVEGTAVFTRGKCVVRAVWDLQSTSPRMLTFSLRYQVDFPAMPHLFMDPLPPPARKLIPG